MNCDDSAYKSLKWYKRWRTSNFHPHLPIRTDVCLIFYCQSASISCCSAFKPWLMLLFFFFLYLIQHRSKKKPTKKKTNFWRSERNSLSLWQPRQLELIISANGKMRKRFFASPTSDSSSVWQLCRHRAAARMFMQTDYGNARQRWMCVCVQFPIPPWLIIESLVQLYNKLGEIGLFSMHRDTAAKNVLFLNNLNCADLQTHWLASPVRRAEDHEITPHLLY